MGVAVFMRTYGRSQPKTGNKIVMAAVGSPENKAWVTVLGGECRQVAANQKYVAVSMTALNQVQVYKLPRWRIHPRKKVGVPGLGPAWAVFGTAAHPPCERFRFMDGVGHVAGGLAFVAPNVLAITSVGTSLLRRTDPRYYLPAVHLIHVADRKHVGLLLRPEECRPLFPSAVCGDEGAKMILVGFVKVQHYQRSRSLASDTFQQHTMEEIRMWTPCQADWSGIPWQCVRRVSISHPRLPQLYPDNDYVPYNNTVQRNLLNLTRALMGPEDLKDAWDAAVRHLPQLVSKQRMKGGVVTLNVDGPVWWRIRQVGPCAYAQEWSMDCGQFWMPLPGFLSLQAERHLTQYLVVDMTYMNVPKGFDMASDRTVAVPDLVCAVVPERSGPSDEFWFDSEDDEYPECLHFLVGQRVVAMQNMSLRRVSWLLSCLLK